MIRLFLLAAVLMVPWPLTEAFSSSTSKISSSNPTSSVLEAHTTTRTAFLLGCVMTLSSAPVGAKEVDPALKGTKQDPAYESCLSKCIYECTKPKGAETKSRSECRADCKQKCATTKQQLMIGTPLN